MVCQRNPGWRVAKAVLNSSCAARHVLSAADSQIRVGISCQPSFLCCWFFCCSGLYRRGLTAGLGDTTQVAAWVWWLSLCWFCFWRGGSRRARARVPRGAGNGRARPPRARTAPRSRRSPGIAARARGCRERAARHRRGGDRDGAGTPCRPSRRVRRRHRFRFRVVGWAQVMAPASAREAAVASVVVFLKSVAAFPLLSLFPLLIPSTQRKRAEPRARGTCILLDDC